MIPVTSQQLQVLESENKDAIQLFRLRKIGESTDIARWCIARFNQTVDGKVYQSNHPLINVGSQPSETALNRGNLEATIVDHNSLWYAQLLPGQGAQINAWVSLMFTAEIGGTTVSTPVFGNGVLYGDGIAKTIDENRGLSTVLGLRNILSKFGSKNVRTTTPASQKEIDATDTAFDKSAESRELNWGQD